MQHQVLLLLIAHAGQTIVSLEEVRACYFDHLNPEVLIRKINSGQIDLIVISLENSQKSAKGVHIEDLAAYLARRREAAIREMAP